MKSNFSIIVIFFLVTGFISNSLSQANLVWYETSRAPVINGFFNVYTGVENGENVQFVAGNEVGIFISTDLGVTWANIGLAGVPVTDFYDNPDNTGEYIATSAGGVYITTDGGSTWPLNNTGIEGLLTTSVVKINNTLLVGTTNGVYQSTDGGTTWQPSGTGLENKFVRSLKFIYMTQDDDGLYALIQGEGLWVFNFQTGEWGPISNIPSFNNTAIASDNISILYVANFDNGVFSSPADNILFTLDLNLQYANDIIGTPDGEVYAASLGGGVKRKKKSGGPWDDVSSGLLEINGYIDVVNLALDKRRLSGDVQHLWAAVNPLEAGGTPGIYRTLEPITDVEDNTSVTPEDFRLEQNYPNPFNPSTTISFSIPEASFVSLKIFSALGEQIETLVAKELNAGNYKYDWKAKNLTSGIYFYTLQTENFVETKKMILLK